MSALFMVFCDGAVEPKNPGGWGVGGWLIKDEQGERWADGAKDLGANPKMTNNIAEYWAVRHALEFMVWKGWTDRPVTVHTDSQLVVKQLTNEYACRTESLRALRDAIWIVLEKFPHTVSFQWIPREQNEEADKMSRSLYTVDRIVSSAIRYQGTEPGFADFSIYKEPTK